MATVKEFKDLGVPFVDGDECKDSVSGKIYGDLEGDNGWASRVSRGGNRFDGDKIISFAWRPLNTLPDNPKFKYEVGFDNHGWRPLLEQSVKLLNEDSLSWKISNIGNVLHNISCSMTTDIEQDEFAEYAITCWSIAKELSNKMEKVDFSTVSLPSNSSDSPVRYDKPKKYMNHSKVKPAFTQEMADKGELPPVGSECKFLWSNLTECSGANQDRTLKVIAYNEDMTKIWAKMNQNEDSNIYKLELLTLKPIDNRTPKQKAIDDIKDILMECGFVESKMTNKAAESVYIKLVEKC